ncbi:acyl-CoA synthetase (AMP-forming)/AMP-acid ligase II [Actinomycetospora succinea]|uniref:Acyl-CoA synthetase (AMP-forming)/AMP-acid ligase II n=1 Tax=Actinomycetospora succinea TaxID=663603 RepID=A0A4R6UY58_9PSEU|nr:long-chain fatty acid--CoA ligase [Actinomycetospora succinea]TDQ50873.1 acyl-CoA synthetase (AMP-forming)/AMP-acid ligase II [Actinomycetospora succinea]
MDLSLGDWPAAQARRRPHAVALVDGVTGERSTYAELADRVSRIGGALDTAGVRAGDRVGLLSTNHPDMLAVVFAIARIGAVGVPVNFRLTPDEITFVLSDAGASFLFASADLAGPAAEVAERVGIGRTVVLGGPATGLESLHEFLTGAGPGPTVAAGADDLVLIMYTSGTTGSPKGAMLTHGNLTWNAINMVSAGEGLLRSDVTLSVAPLFHIGALGIFTLPLLYLGGTVVTVPRFDPVETAALMAREGVTVQFLVPAMWAMLMRADVVDFDGSRVRWVLSGGAPCPLPVIRHFADRGWAFLEGFGLTETSPTCTVMDRSAVPAKAGSVGLPLRHVEARVDAPDGTPGELTIRGPNVFVGYWQRPDATAEALVDGWFHTGDVAVRDADGYLTIVDRTKDMVITGGENVYPAEVERVLSEHPGVVDVAVIGVPDEQWGERVTAIVVGSVSAEDVVAHCRGRLAGYKCPRAVELVEEIPRNATGKILKRDLRARFGSAAAAVTR